MPNNPQYKCHFKKEKIESLVKPLIDNAEAYRKKAAAIEMKLDEGYFITSPCGTYSDEQIKSDSLADNYFQEYMRDRNMPVAPIELEIAGCRSGLQDLVVERSKVFSEQENISRLIQEKTKLQKKYTAILENKFYLEHEFQDYKHLIGFGSPLALIATGLICFYTGKKTRRK